MIHAISEICPSVRNVKLRLEILNFFSDDVNDIHFIYRYQESSMLRTDNFLFCINIFYCMMADGLVTALS